MTPTKDGKIKLGSTNKEKKQQLMEDIASANIKKLYFKEQGNKRAYDTWDRIVKCLENKLEEMKRK